MGAKAVQASEILQGNVADAVLPGVDAHSLSSAHKRHFSYWSPSLLLFVAVWIISLYAIAPDASGLIETNWVFIPIGVAGALLGNISAVGGGIVFIPCIIFIFHLPPLMALKIALATQSFGMTSGAIGWLQKKGVPLRALNIAVPGLLIGSTISSFVIHPSALLVKLLFGPVSILLGVLTLVLSVRNKAAKGRADIPAEARWPLFFSAVLGGLITGWVAIGEGEIVAALLMLAYGVEVTASIGLGVVLLSINSIYLALVHQFYLGGIPWEYAAFTGLGAVFGARLAPWLSRHTNPITLKAIFAAIAIGDGIVFVVQYIATH
jgi:uncharacterized membrane protein YfcA